MASDPVDPVRESAAEMLGRDGQFGDFIDALYAAGYRLAGPGEVVVPVERLRAADDVAAVFGWCPAGEDSEREKAAVMLWRRWSALAGSSPKDHPHLTDEYLAGLAREWDAVRERARTGLARIVSVERATSPESTEVSDG